LPDALERFDQAATPPDIVGRFVDSVHDEADAQAVEGLGQDLRLSGLGVIGVGSSSTGS